MTEYLDPPLRMSGDWGAAMNSIISLLLIVTLLMSGCSSSGEGPFIEDGKTKMKWIHEGVKKYVEKNGAAPQLHQLSEVGYDIDYLNQETQSGGPFYAGGSGYSEFRLSNVVVEDGRLLSCIVKMTGRSPTAPGITAMFREGEEPQFLLGSDAEPPTAP